MERKKFTSWIWSIFVAIVLGLISFLIFNFCLLNYNNKIVFVNFFADFGKNDIVVFYNPYQKQSTNKSVRRIVACPGQSFKIVNQKIFVDNKELILKQCKSLYQILIFNPWDKQYLKDYNLEYQENNIYKLDNQTFVKIKLDNKLKNIKQISLQRDYRDYNIFPFSKVFCNNKDNFGEILIPKKNLKIKLNAQNYTLYKYIIINFENQKIECKDNQFLLNGSLCDTYTFKNNYYFVFSDDFEDVSDSRTLGFIPESLIIGKVN